MRRQFEVDKFHKAAVFMSEVHNLVHKGFLFSASHVFSALANGSNADMLVVVDPSRSAHVRLGLSTTGQGVGRFFSSPTVSVAGTAVATRNRNTFSSRTLDGVTITHTPTVSATGTEQVGSVIPGGGKNQAVGASEEGFSEWILQPGTYLLRFNNTSGAAVDVSLELEIYQPDQR